MGFIPGTGIIIFGINPWPRTEWSFSCKYPDRARAVIIPGNNCAACYRSKHSHYAGHHYVAADTEVGVAHSQHVWIDGAGRGMAIDTTFPHRGMFVDRFPNANARAVRR